MKVKTPTMYTTTQVKRFRQAIIASTYNRSQGITAAFLARVFSVSERSIRDDIKKVKMEREQHENLSRRVS